jgi:hypothetical protein
VIHVGAHVHGGDGEIVKLDAVGKSEREDADKAKKVKHFESIPKTGMLRSKLGYRRILNHSRA